MADFVVSGDHGGQAIIGEPTPAQIIVSGALKGADGSPGATGAVGPTGPQGEQGPIGPAGADIFSGPDAPLSPSTGDLWWDSDDTAGDDIQIDQSQVNGLTTALAATEKTVYKGAASGYAGLDSSSLVLAANMRPFVDRGAVVASTTYNPWDTAVYRGRRILFTKTVATGTGTAPFISSANYVMTQGERDINAYDFGYRADGNTATASANRLALQNAIDFVAALGGGMVTLPFGFGYINATIELKDRVWVQGQGMRGSTVALAPTSNCHMFKNHVSTNGTTDKNSQFNALLNMCIDGQKANQSAGTYHGIYFDTNPSTTVGGDSYFDPKHLLKDVVFTNMKGDGVHIDGRSDVRVVTCCSQFNDGIGFDSSFDTMFLGCIAEQNGLEGFYVQNGSVYINSCKAFNNGAVTAARGIGFSVYNTNAVTIAGCQAQNNQAHGFQLDTVNSVVLSGVSDSNNLSNGSYYGVNMNAATDCIVDVVCSQGKQGGVQIGNQLTALRLAGSSTGNAVKITHKGNQSVVVGNALSGDSSIAGNSVTVNSGSLTNVLSILNDVALSSLSDTQVLAYDATSGKWKNSSLAGGSFAGGVIGDGSDGAVNMDGTNTYASFASKSGSTYTLTRDVFSSSFTIASGVTLKPAGYKIFCTNTVTNASGAFMNADGNNGTATAGGSNTGNGSLGAGQAGGAGNTGAGSGGTGGGFGVGNGGAGGLGASGAAGGAGFSQNGGTWMLRAVQGVLTGVLNYLGASQLVRGGSGGGGGGGDGTNRGGGGGSGGGLIVIFARNFVNNGTISAVGGNGFVPASGNCGGGGGGGGGTLLTFTLNAITNTGTVSLSGGSGASGVGTGASGSNGTTGTALNVVMQQENDMPPVGRLKIYENGQWYYAGYGTKGPTGDTGPQGPAGDPATNLVTSVAGKQGVVILTKNDVELANVDNTSDANKPISTATQTALDLKQDSIGYTTENVANKSTSTTLGTSDTLYPSQKAVKTYIDNAVASATPADATTVSKGIVQLAGDLAGTAASPTVPGLAGKESSISAGTSLQYWRGDKSWQTLNTSVVPESGSLYYTDTRARAALSGTTNQVNYNSSTGVLSLPQNIHTGASPTFAGLTIDTSSLVVDGTNHRVGILTTAPTHALTVGFGGGVAVYNTSDQTTNYERLLIDISSNTYRIRHESGGTGSIRDILIGNTKTMTLRNGQFSAGSIQFNTGLSSANVSGVNFLGSQTASSGVTTQLLLSPTVNQTLTATMTLIGSSVTRTSVGSGGILLFDMQVGGTSKFKVDENGNITLPSGAKINIGTPSTYTITNATTDRSYDADATTVDELADALATLVGDLRAIGLVL